LPILIGTFGQRGRGAEERQACKDDRNLKTLFDEQGPSGTSPFHEYTMRQAIEEGFIMDVLQNYTTYKRFFGLIKQVENDPEVPRKKAAKALTRYLELHPVNIEQVVSVIVEHFRLNVMHELGGRAKAMGRHWLSARSRQVQVGL
jgi:type I restriction enzyme R subunit